MQRVLKPAQNEPDSFVEAADHTPGRIILPVFFPTLRRFLHLTGGAVEIVQHREQGRTNLFGRPGPELGSLVPGTAAHVREVRLRPPGKILGVRHFLFQRRDPALQRLDFGWMRRRLGIVRSGGIPGRGAVRAGGFRKRFGSFSP